MFPKNIIVYRLTEPLAQQNQTDLEYRLMEMPFLCCGKHEMKRLGWVDPTGGAQDALVYGPAGIMGIRLLFEEKKVKPSILSRMTNDKIKEIEIRDQRKVYRKERDQLKDEIILNLRPGLPPERRKTDAFIIDDEWIIVEAASFKKSEELLSQLRNALGSLPVAMLDVQQSPSAVMTHWLSQDAAPKGVVLGSKCVLRSSISDKGRVQVSDVDLPEDIREHLESGMRVVELEIKWEEKIQFVLTEGLQIKQIKLTDQMVETFDAERENSGDHQLQHYDADLTLLRLEMKRLLPALLSWFGGESD